MLLRLGLRRQTLEKGRNFWQRAKQARLYSDQFQALKGREHLSALGSQQRGTLAVSAKNHTVTVWRRRERERERERERYRQMHENNWGGGGGGGEKGCTGSCNSNVLLQRFVMADATTICDAVPTTVQA